MNTTEIKLEGVKISNADIIDAHKGEVFGRIIATDKAGRQVGILQFSEYENGVWVQGIEVDSKMRGQGIALAMRNKLQEEYPEATVK